MFGKSLVVDMINRSSETAADRRSFLRGMGLVGLGVAGAGVAGAALAPAASADAATDAATDAAVLNFALNLEYLEAEFYSYAAFGHGLTPSLTTGTGTHGGVLGGRKVLFKDRGVRQYAEEIAHDEIAHVRFLRTALAGSAVSRPAIDLKTSFTAAARAAQVVGPTEEFDPFASDDNFLLGAYIFEDVGVTAYKGAAPLITNKTYLDAAAGILAVEAYHAAIVRSELFERGLKAPALTDAANKISDARDSLDGPTDDDQGISDGTGSRIVPSDDNSIAFSRKTNQVLNVVYLTAGSGVTKGGFFPNGVNGGINSTTPTA